MTTIARLARRRRDSDSSFPSTNSDLYSDDTYDTNSLVSDQSNSMASNASEHDSLTRRPSNSHSDNYDTDSDQQSHAHTDDDDDNGSLNSNKDNTVLNDKAPVDNRTGLDTVQTQGSTSTSKQRSSAASAKDTPRTTTNDSANTYERVNTNIQREKKLWWGDNGNDTGQHRHSSTYSRRESAHPTNKDRHDSGWKSSFKNRRLDSSWRTTENEPSTPRNDWRSQLSPTTEEKAASHWTMASIDQHLLETKADEMNWKKKQQEARHEVEWPSLAKQQQHTPKTTTLSQLPDPATGTTPDSSLPPTKVQLDRQHSDISSGTLAANDTPQTERPTTSTISWDTLTKTDAPDHGSSKSLLAIINSSSQETNVVAGSAHQPDDTGSWIESKIENNESKGSGWGKWPQTLEDDTQHRQIIPNQKQSHSSHSSDKNVYQLPVTMQNDFDGCDDKGIRVLLPPRHAPKTKHGYLENKRALNKNELETVGRFEDQRYRTDPAARNSIDVTGTVTNDSHHQQLPPSPSPSPSSELISFSKYIRQDPIVQHPMDEAWWRASGHEEIKESDMEQHQQEQRQEQTYFYIPQWRHSSFVDSINSNDTAQSMTTRATPPDSHDDSDYNRNQIPYTIPSGHRYQGPSSRPLYFGKSNTPYY